MRRTLRLLAATLAGLAGPAGAHPHVFVDALAGFRLDADGRLAAVRITWTYDPFSTLTMIYLRELDPDGDGRLDAADRAALAAGETDWPEGYDGDVHLDRAGAPVAMGRPENAEAWMQEGRVTVAFDLPLATPLVLSGPVRLRLYDPGYYYAYDVIGLDATSDAACAALVVPFEPDAAARALQRRFASLAHEEMAGRTDIGARFADAVHLSCD